MAKLLGKARRNCARLRKYPAFVLPNRKCFQEKLYATMGGNIDKLLFRSSVYQDYVETILAQPLYENSDRLIVSRVMCSVSLEHAESFKMLLAARNFTSAISLLRLQFECLVRGMWVLYVASDVALTKLTSDLSEESQKRANNLPMLSEMISQLEKRHQKMLWLPSWNLRNTHGSH